MVVLKTLDMMFDMPPEHIIDGDISRLEASIPSVATAATATTASSSNTGCKSDHEDGRGQGTLVAVTVPSLSLFNNYQGDCDNGATASNTTLSRDEIQIQTAECMSRPIRFDIMKEKEKNMNDKAEGASAVDLKQQALESETYTLALQSAATQMLDGCIESMDQLVDARLSAYSKILRQHYGGKKNDHPTNDHDEDVSNSSKHHSHLNNVVDFKLRTLLGLGTNISFDSILLKIRSDVGFEPPKSTLKPQRQERNQEKKMQDVNQEKMISMEKHIVLEVVMNGLSIGGDKQQQEEEELEQCEGKASIDTNSNYGNSDNDNDTKNKHLQQQHVIRLETPGIVLVQKEDDETEEALAERETETETKKGTTVAGSICNVTTVSATTTAKTNDNNSVRLLLLDTPSTRPNYVDGGLRKQKQMQEQHVLSSFQAEEGNEEEKQTRQVQQQVPPLESNLDSSGDSEPDTRRSVAAVTVSTTSTGSSNHTDTRENCEGGNHKHKQSGTATGADAPAGKQQQHAGSESSYCCPYSLTVQVDTKKLLAAMMNEAEKIVGRVVEITNDAWKQHQQEEHNQEKNNQLARAEAAGLAAASSSSSSSISPKLGAKTVSEASFVPLNMAILDRKQAAESEEEVGNEAKQSPAEEQQSIPAGVFSASAGAAAAHVPQPPPPESPNSNSSSSGSKKRSWPGYDDSNSNENMENYSPIDPAAAERASHIVDFVFGEIEFVTPPPLVSPGATGGTISTFKLSPVRKKMKQSTPESPSPLCLSSVPARPPSPATASLLPVPSLPGTGTTSTSGIHTGTSTN